MVWAFYPFQDAQDDPTLIKTHMTPYIDRLKKTFFADERSSIPIIFLLLFFIKQFSHNLTEMFILFAS